MSHPAQLSATEARTAIEQGALTSEALIRDCQSRIRARADSVGAWAHLDFDKALEAARESDQRRKTSGPMGPLDGIPVGIKDIIDTKDYHTEHGTPVFAGRQPAADAFVVACLREAGAIILGKTVTTELAFFGPGKTKNPRDPGRTPGGSSSGSAAAVADWQVPLALGTQTAGSIIRPASYCGCIGFKPAFGRVSRSGILGQSAPLDTIGGYARTIEDIALLMDVIAQPDPNDPDMSRTSVSFSAKRRVSERVPRLAFIKTPSWPSADDDARQALEAFAGGFGVSAEVVEIGLPAEFDGSLRLQQIVQFSDIAKNYGPIVDANTSAMSPKLKEIVAEGRRFSSADREAALAEREPLYEALLSLMRGYDAILTPAAPGVALEGLSSTGSPAFNALWTFLGMPCLSLPLLELGGLPLGIQITAARDAEAALLDTADWLMRRKSPKS